jgi:hypothetical protein
VALCHIVDRIDRTSGISIELDRLSWDCGGFECLRQSDRLVDAIAIDASATQNPSARGVVVGGSSRCDAANEIAIASPGALPGWAAEYDDMDAGRYIVE